MPAPAFPSSAETVGPTARRATVRDATLDSLRAAFMLLTRLPVGSSPLSVAARRWAAAWFPLVGGVIGGIGAALFAASANRAGGFLAAVLALGATALLTGALHEDGLADTADALGGARDRDRLFAILKDSRIGTYGALALALALLLRVGTLDRLGVGAAPAALLLASVLSRLALVWLMATLPYVTPSAVARSADVARAGLGPLVSAHLVAVGLLGVLVRFDVIAVAAIATSIVALATTTLLCAWRFRARAGGITGDFLGAAQQVGEVAVLLTLTLTRHR